MKILISWEAYKNDYADAARTQVSSTGIHFALYNSEWRYDKHILLSSSAKHEAGIENLAATLRRHFPDKTNEIRYMNVERPYGWSDILPKITALLHEQRDNDIELLLSSGTQVMRAVWVHLHMTLAINTRLVLLMQKSDLKPGETDSLRVIAVPSLTAAQSLVLKQATLHTDVYSSKVFTDTPQLKNIYKQAQEIAVAVAEHKIAVLITGATGTGKEFLAEHIYNHSGRSKYGTINCAAFTDELLRSEMFGHKKGAFTGADSDKKGLVEQYKGGVLFMDEIGDISDYMQAALLRFLQSKEYYRVGDDHKKQSDVSLIFATNRNLQQQCRRGKFRWDLYYRISVMTFHLPLLNSYAPADFEKLVQHISQQHSETMKLPVMHFTPDHINLMLQHQWHGNIRQLYNVLQYLYLMARHNDITRLLAQRLKTYPQRALSLDNAENKHIRKVLKLHDGNQSKTAQVLGITVNTLKNKLKKYKIQREKYKQHVVQE